MRDKTTNQAEYFVAIASMFAFLEYIEENSNSLESRVVLLKSKESLRKSVAKFSKSARKQPLIEGMVGGFKDVFAHAQKNLEERMREAQLELENENEK